MARSHFGLNLKLFVQHTKPRTQDIYLFIKPIAADINITDWIQQMDMWLPRQQNSHYTIWEFLQDVHVASESPVIIIKSLSTTK